MTTPIRVLVVDDAELARTTLRAILGRAGHDVRLAGSVGEAWRELETWGPDCVVLDHRLPDGDGAVLAQEIRHHPVHGDLRLVLMSGDPLPADVVSVADVFLLKPARARDVLSAVSGSETT